MSWVYSPDCWRALDGRNELNGVKEELATLKSPELEAHKQAERAREEEERRELEREKRTNNVLRVAAHRCARRTSKKRSRVPAAFSLRAPAVRMLAG